MFKVVMQDEKRSFEFDIMQKTKGESQTTTLDLAISPQYSANFMWNITITLFTAKWAMGRPTVRTKVSRCNLTSGSSPAIAAIEDKDLVRLRELFESGQATPLDRESYSMSSLIQVLKPQICYVLDTETTQAAAYDCAEKIIQCLIAEGAPIIDPLW